MVCRGLVVNKIKKRKEIRMKSTCKEKKNRKSIFFSRRPLHAVLFVRWWSGVRIHIRPDCVLKIDNMHMLACQITAFETLVLDKY